MKSFKPTTKQAKVIEAETNCVVIANPGSGKTGTIAHKIRRILPQLPHYKGVIAISYTNQASDELEKRCLFDGVDGKESFFGTIHSFQLREIIVPFGAHLFRPPTEEITVIEKKELDYLQQLAIPDNLDVDRSITDKLLHTISALYADGKVLLESFGFMADYILKQSASCRNYLKARYSHIIIDEYQDCEYWQHTLFLQLVELGITGLAVGDPHQSIFGFAGRDSRYLVDLLNHNSFTPFSLDQNHRSHPSIVYYSTKLIAPKLIVDSPPSEKRVLHKHINGSEIEITHWISDCTDEVCELYNVDHKKDISILCRNNYTQERVSNTLEIPHRSVLTTPLDKSLGIWAKLFRTILTFIFDKNTTKHEVIEKNVLYSEISTATKRRIKRMLQELEDTGRNSPEKLVNELEKFIEVARLLLPENENSKTIAQLQETLGTERYRSSYLPPAHDEIQVMTIHKAKGMEFDIVFHLNLYRYIFPREEFNPSRYVDWQESLNTHYVGITRARKAVILCTSDYRHNERGEQKKGLNSPLMDINDLPKLREICPF